MYIYIYFVNFIHIVFYHLLRVHNDKMRLKDNAFYLLINTLTFLTYELNFLFETPTR